MSYTPLRRYFRGQNLATMHDVQANQRRQYHFDHQGTTQALTNEAGTVTDRFAADAWGTESRRTGYNTNRNWYAGNYGYYHDKNTQPAYIRARYMKTSLGAFLSIDPIHPNSTIGPFRYAENSPCKNVDPTGEQVRKIEIIPTHLPNIKWLLPGEDGPNTACCGAIFAAWKFRLLINECKSIGYFVQKVNISGSRRLCAKDSDLQNKSCKIGDVTDQFFEMWEVPAGSLWWSGNQPPNARFRHTDQFSEPICPNTYGSIEKVGELRFFCSTTIGKRIVLGEDGWSVDANSGPSGDLPFTRQTPIWWDSKFDKENPPNVHTAQTTWRCCCPPRRWSVGYALPDRHEEFVHDLIVRSC